MRAIGKSPFTAIAKRKGKKKQDAECVGDPKEREENCRQPLLVVEEQETATPERAASPERTNARAIHGTSGTGRPQPAVGARRPVKTARRRTPPCPVAPVPQSVDRCAVVSSSCLQRSGALALALLCSSASQPFTPASTYHAARHFPFSFFFVPFVVVGTSPDAICCCWSPDARVCARWTNARFFSKAQRCSRDSQVATRSWPAPR
jgi:hypothetical protein